MPKEEEPEQNLFVGSQGIKVNYHKRPLIFLLMIKILNWNIRGMKSQVATERLVYLAKTHDVSFIALQEHFLQDTSIERFKSMLGMDGCFANISNKI